ncbi:RNA-binding domain-containing protein [Polychaeton citri CBS 116435]|uniref:RNA-binding domain-containing protein n=1 Tax=Polychaeton citri CBS 116435 TaxID=1314669 RepID=A0A9P4UQA1_9PEZI|nr:RNA-binding domain-containing protein [Polychaeton citri CBS 116435]
MFIGGLNWETTDQSLKDYFSQFGEVVECTVMRDGATGRSRGFGFLTFKDPKCVNVVMVKEHSLDGKLIDPKRAIPRDEQERTAKIFVGGVSQEATESDFKEFFMQFGRVLDATLMMDKDTGRPRGFGFVTFDNEAAVDRTLEQPLAIHGKMIEVKRAQPRGNMREEDAGGRGGKFGRHSQSNASGAGSSGAGNFQDFTQQNQMAQAGPGNNMSPAMMAQYWQRMQQYFQMMQQQMMQGNMNPGMMQGMQGNPQMMQQMMANMQRGGGGNPQMMQQMQQMQQMAGMQGGGFPGMAQNSGDGSPGPGSPHPPFNAQDQMMFEQRKYEQQSMARMQQGNFNGNSTWEGMYDDVPAPAGMSPGPTRGGFRGGRGGGGGGGAMNRSTPQPAGQAPANAPTGPKNAGKPGANYRGGGRGGGHRGRFDPYGRGGAGGG